jgi:hypothetical protein
MNTKLLLPQKSFIYLFIFFVLMLSACKSKSGKTNFGFSDESSASDANKIISYTNDIIDVLKEYNDAAKKAVNYYGQLEDKMNGKSSFLMSNTSMNFLFTAASQAKNAFGAPTEALGNDKKFFKDSVGTYHKLFKAFISNDSTLNLYVKAEDFKDDQFAKGKDLVNKQYEIYPQLIRLREVIGNKIDQVAEAAEEISLKDSPIKGAYKAAKTDLAKLKKVADMIAIKAADEKYTDVELTAIETNYNELMASIDNNKDVDKEQLEKEHKTAMYSSFYKSLLNNVSEIKPIVRNIKETKKLSESDYNTLNNRYESVVSSYNSWVK